MTHNEFKHILTSINALSPDQMRRLARELESRIASRGKPAAPAVNSGHGLSHFRGPT